MHTIQPNLRKVQSMPQWETFDTRAIIRDQSPYDVFMDEDFEKDIRESKLQIQQIFLVKVGKLLIEYPAEKQQNKESYKQRPKKSELGNGTLLSDDLTKWLAQWRRK